MFARTCAEAATLRREERLYDREAVLGRDASSVFPSETKTLGKMDKDAAAAVLGSMQFVTESQVPPASPDSSVGGPSLGWRSLSPLGSAAMPDPICMPQTASVEAAEGQARTRHGSPCLSRPPHLPSRGPVSGAAPSLLLPMATRRTTLLNRDSPDTAHLMCRIARHQTEVN